MKINIFYKTIKMKKINGSLFYCFEYFEFLSHYTDVEFHIQEGNEGDVEDFKKMFMDKYDFDHKLLDNIKVIPRITDIYHIKGDKAFFLDYGTFKYFYQFINNQKVIVYKNKKFNFPITKKDVTYFGFYDYQAPYDIKENLKFNFEIYPEVDDFIITDTAYVTSPGVDYQKVIDDNIIETNILKKDVFSHQNNLFESFDTLYYYHVGHIDLNNRFIVESMFYNKNIHIIDKNPNEDDSVVLGFMNIIDNGLKNFEMDRSDKIIKALLE